jgi:hypothetical protein
MVGKNASPGRNKLLFALQTAPADKTAKSRQAITNAWRAMIEAPEMRSDFLPESFCPESIGAFARAWLHQEMGGAGRPKA